MVERLKKLSFVPLGLTLVGLTSSLAGCGRGEIDEPVSDSGVYAVGAEGRNANDEAPGGRALAPSGTRGSDNDGDGAAGADGDTTARSNDTSTDGAGGISLGGATLDMPDDWKPSTPSSSFRLAEYTVPGPAGDAGFVIFTGIGGSVEANVQRWRGQFTTADGGSVEPVIETSSIGRFTVTTVTLEGNFTGGMMNEHVGNDTMMVQAIVERSEDEKYFLRLLGPSATVAAARPAFDAVLSSLQD